MHEQYQKAKERGYADLASITAATSSLHIDAMSKSKPSCYKCGYSHLNGKCPAKGQQCYADGGYNHCTALCHQKGCRQNKQQRGFKPKKHFSSCGCHTSCSPRRHRCRSHSFAVIPGPHLTALHVAHPVAHPIGTPHIPKGTLHPTGTSRML